ncbi:MAG: hypothetical protein QOK15_3035 [Nocardioidaceae bacterium]|nr:hypothetical protein [Nocardioidaceae bacterium]
MNAPGLDPVLVGEAGQADAEKRARGCTRPVRLVGSTNLVDRSTGEIRQVYSSGSELDGITYVRCGNRRAAVCPSCSAEYKGDAWHLLMCGLAGGKGIPITVATHPCTFATLTAPSFGPVHGLRQKGPCRARRDRPVCSHGRPARCTRRHSDGDPVLGQPLCPDCYDYLAHVVWQWHAPELWRRFCIALQRDLAARCGLTVPDFRRRCVISYSKVVEFQARGVIHVHVPIRLDGPQGPDGPAPEVGLTTSDLEDAVHATAARVVLDSAPLRDGSVYRLRWGARVDTRTITDTADQRSRSPHVAHPRQVAAYLAKYLTKATEDFGLPQRVMSAAHAATTGASVHAVRLIETAQHLAEHGGEPYTRLLAHLACLGYRGHPVTKSRGYSVTFGQIRRAKRLHRSRPAGLEPDADIRELLDEDEEVPEGFEVVSSWAFIGQGYLELDAAADAVRSAALARFRRASDLEGKIGYHKEGKR